MDAVGAPVHPWGSAPRCGFERHRCPARHDHLVCAQGCARRPAMSNRMIRPRITLPVLMLVGCWSVVNVPARPSAQGTWTGVAESITLYNKDGDRYEALTIYITTGPKLKYQDGREYPVSL